MKRVNIVGLGPGDREQMTLQAIETLKRSEVIIGYTVYVDLIRHHYPNKKILSTPMKKEVDRCRMAVEEALKGQEVSMVCSGDAGIYGMAGLVYQVAEDYPDVDIRVIPGITAACSGAALLGAPLTHDFAVISLSDLLTPWELIEKRLRCAAEAEFTICLYNPSSIKRHDYLQKACDIILNYRKEDTVCGIAINIGREGESGRVMSLKELRNTPVDMFTTVFIGSPLTWEIDGKMVTARGYFMEGKKDE